ncbi:MAG: NAD-dependent succinate-semialdehyde dehydrogenase [Methylococcales bacterium]|nr:NAD-dependent succinate-semialdehyde dehydrogenase [Methylococcales bacterium]
MTIRSINPANEEILKEYSEHSDAEINDILGRSVQAFTFQKSLTFDQGSEKMEAVAKILDSDQNKFAKILTLEMGKTYQAAQEEIRKCAVACRYYAENAHLFLADQDIKTNSLKSFVRYHPLGPILAIMPWNFPFWQVFRFAVPALMAGNTALLKHASNVPQAALAIEEIFRQAGFTDGVFQTLLIGSDKVEKILSDNRVKAVTLTGSEKAGATVAGIAGSQIKKTVLELGGSDPFIVMPSADLDDAVQKATRARIQNNGQSCIAAKRFIIHAAIYDDFRSALKQKFAALKVGDPMDEATDIGPLATAKTRDDLNLQVEDSIKKSAIRVMGAEAIAGPGYFYKPGILENIPWNAPAAQDELFGPVACLFRVKSFEEAIALANNTRFGLGSAVFTRDKNEIEQAINLIEAGCTFINNIVASDPRLPFGGIKASGYGRELAAEGIREFVNIKTVAIDGI